MRALILPVLLVFLNLTLAAAGPATPEALVSELYQTHEAGRSPFFQTKDRVLVDRYFTRELADLIWKDAKTPEGQTGAIDIDPLYNSQDPEIKKLVVNKASIDGGSCTVLVTFENYETKQRVIFKLARQDGSWKISNIEYNEGLSVLKMLKAGGSN